MCQYVNKRKPKPLQMQFSALDGLPIVPEQYSIRVEN